MDTPSAACQQQQTRCNLAGGSLRLEPTADPAATWPTPTPRITQAHLQQLVGTSRHDELWRGALAP
eukprot:1154560-Pelagomonas_calceolata.AAC.10